VPGQKLKFFARLFNYQIFHERFRKSFPLPLFDWFENKRTPEALYMLQ
jgi:hypothetical protein